MRTDTQAKLLAYLKQHGHATAKQLAEYLNISPQALFKHLAKLRLAQQITKTGTPPRVFYALAETPVVPDDLVLDDKIRAKIDDEYLFITPAGEERAGAAGFAYWCQKQGLPLAKTAREYVQTLTNYEAHKQGGLIDGTKKLQQSFADVALDRLYYLDFYSIERFGKTRLGQLLLYAKQSQNRRYISNIVQQVAPAIFELIAKHQIQGIGFVPPTVKRAVQFMSLFRSGLDIPLPEIRIIKVKTPVVVPQKTLSKLADRIENAQKTFVVESGHTFGTILLLDDAVGSGASLNEIAKQIKNKGIAKKVIGLAITGSFSGFDVISEI